MGHHLSALFYQLLVHLPANCSYYRRSSLTINEYTAIVSFRFAEEICQEHPNLYITQLIKKTLILYLQIFHQTRSSMFVWTDIFCNDNKNPPIIAERDFGNLPGIVTEESFFTFNNKCYTSFTRKGRDHVLYCLLSQKFARPVFQNLDLCSCEMLQT